MESHLPLSGRPAGWIDSHAHLDRLNENELLFALQEAKRANVSTILEASTDLATAMGVARHCGEYPAILGAVGISPSEVLTLPSDWEDQLASLVKGRIVAIGEIGLDAKNPGYPALDKQRPAFERQLEIALRHDLPVVLHTRGAEELCADLCRLAGVSRALFHCFTGSEQALAKIVEFGYDVSFSGIVTFDPSLLAMAARVPADRLFIETDSPYLSPAPFRGKPNTPARVSVTGQALAKARGLSNEELQKILADNFVRLFAEPNRHDIEG